MTTKADSAITRCRTAISRNGARIRSSALKYQEILSKQTEAQVAQNLEAERKGEKFTLIEPPQPPEKPVSPNSRLLIMIRWPFW